MSALRALQSDDILRLTKSAAIQWWAGVVSPLGLISSGDGDDRDDLVMVADHLGISLEAVFYAGHLAGVVPSRNLLNHKLSLQEKLDGERIQCR